MTTPRETSPQSPGGLRRWAVILPELVALALCIPMWLATNEWTSSVGGPGPAFYPRLLIGLLVAAMIVRLIQDVTSIRRGVAEPDEDSMVMEEGVEMDASLIDIRKVVVVIALSVAYVIASVYIGWVLATFAVVLAFLWLSGKRNPLIIVPVALVLSLGMVYVFVKIVYISLPTGVGAFDEFTILLFELLGIY